MDKNQLLIIASVVFGIVGLLHLLRSILSLDLIVGNFNVPLFVSYVVVIVLGYLSWSMFKASKS